MIAKIGQRVAELVRELEAVLRPVGTLSGQTDRDTAVRGTLEIELRVIGPMVDLDAAESSAWAMSPKFTGGGLQHGRNIRGTDSSKTAGRHMDIKRSRS